MADSFASSPVVLKIPNGGSFEYFVEQFLLKNRPCLFDEALTREWPARQQWVEPEGQPNLAYLNKHYGDLTVPVADCGKEKFSAHPKTEMKMADYLSYWADLMKEKDQVERGDSSRKLLYLKDWHLARESMPNSFYTTLAYFRSDWLNEVWSQREDVQDDYRFVYMGPTGTWTPFHADVFRSYSWSTNVCGSKEWLLFPPGQEDHFRDRLGNLPFDITSDDLKDRGRYPNVSQACRPIRVVQNAGETLFVPSGWYHQVRNLKDTISVNHNWTNAFGAPFMWGHLQSELRLVCAELDDCRNMDNWHGHCQVVLKACTGIDYSEFAQFLCVVGLPRLSETNSLLSTLHLPPCDLLVSIKEKLLKISRNKLSFFKSGTLPEELSHAVTVADGLSMSDRLREKPSSITETNSQTFALLVPLMSAEFQDIVSSKKVKDIADLAEQWALSRLIFRLYELTTINRIVDELCKEL